MTKTKTSNIQQGNLSPVEYFQSKKKSNKVYGIILGGFVLFLVSLTFIL